MNFEQILTENLTVVVVLACLVIGYVIKHASFLKRIPNDDIPGILAVSGAVLNSVVAGVSVNSIVYGAFMGLASTGLHQAFHMFIDGKSEIPQIEDEELDK